MQAAYTRHGDKSETRRLDPWVCYECGHEGNESESCAVCRAKPDNTVTADGIIELVFSENPSTGFEWSCTVTPEDALGSVSDRFISDMSAEEQEYLTGVGGTHIYRFRPVKDGRVILCFVLSRGADEVVEERVYTYEVKGGVPARVLGEINTWVCGCGSMHNRMEQDCYSCEKAMPGLEDGWFCDECGRYRTKDEASCPNCGEARTYENGWVCTCGYTVPGGYSDCCERCGTVPPGCESAWICPGCDSLNVGEQPCALCDNPVDRSGEAWVCECRHLNNWFTSTQEHSKVCEKCGKPRPADR